MNLIHSLLLLFFLHRLTPTQIQAYKSYIVGGDYGWMIPATGFNYTAWASNFTFSLGDSLVFHYAAEHSVIQTTNLTTYQGCDSTVEDDALQIWSSINSTDSTVLLTTTGDNYFFCSTYDGEHCQSGMKFAIHVEFGQGLPMTPLAAPEAGNDDDGDSNFPDFNTFNPPPPPPPLADESGSETAILHRILVMMLPMLLLATVL